MDKIYPIGLTNEGNSCYFNVVIQCILHLIHGTDAECEIFKLVKHINPIWKHIYDIYSRTFKIHTYGKYATYKTDAILKCFLSQVDNTYIEKNKQNDAYETLVSILETAPMTIKNKLTILSTTCTVRTNKDTKEISNTKWSSNHVNVTISSNKKSNVRMQTLITNMICPEKISDTITKQMHFNKIGSKFIVIIGRWESSHRSKVIRNMLFIDPIIKIPIVYNIGDEGMDKTNKIKYIYKSFKLEVVVNHIGNRTTSGHYIIYRKISDDKWVCIDDRNISILSSNDVIYNNRNCYICIYSLI